MAIKDLNVQELVKFLTATNLTDEECIEVSEYLKTTDDKSAVSIFIACMHGNNAESIKKIYHLVMNKLINIPKELYSVCVNEYLANKEVKLDRV